MNNKLKNLDEVLYQLKRVLRSSVAQIKEFEDVSELEGLELKNLKEAYSKFKDCICAIDNLYRDKDIYEKPIGE